jgi:hypothetical protein
LTTIPIIVFDCTLTVYFVSSKENKILVPKKDTVKLAFIYNSADRELVTPADRQLKYIEKLVLFYK